MNVNEIMNKAADAAESRIADGLDGSGAAQLARVIARRVARVRVATKARARGLGDFHDDFQHLNRAEDAARTFGADALTLFGEARRAGIRAGLDAIVDAGWDRPAPTGDTELDAILSGS